MIALESSINLRDKMKMYLPEKTSNYQNENKLKITLLQNAILNGTIEIVEKILQSNVDVNELNSCHKTALHIAVIENKLDIVKLLIHYKANLNIKVKRSGMTALHLAVKCRNLEIVKVLLENGANINELSKHESTALHIALEQKDESMVDLLLDYGADVSLKKFGKSSLHLAAESRSITIAQLLLNRGANINDTCNDTSNVLHVALELKDKEMVQLLLQHGAQVNVNKFGKTTFLLVVENNCKDIAELLLHADINELDSKNKCLALHQAFEKKDKEMVKIFLENNVDPNFKKIDKSPLHFACEYEWEDIVTLLISKGAKINELDRDTISGLYIAMEKKNVAITQLLLKHGANVDVQHDRNGLTPLHLAVKHGFIDLAKSFLERGANVDAMTTLSVTPLHIAFDERSFELVLLLIDYNANTNTPKYGKSLLEIAVESRWIPIVGILLKKGADPNVFSDEGNNSVFGLATKQFCIDILKCFIKYNVNVNILNDKCLQSPLQCAVYHKWIEAAKLLIAHGADVNKSVDGKTAFSIALMRKDRNMVRLLIENRANINIKIVTDMGPLHVAAENNWLDIAELLIKRGMKVKEETMYYLTPIHFAVQKSHIDMMKLLIKHGADINVKKSGSTLLHNAAYFEYIGVVEFLLDAGAKINETNEQDLEMITALHIALKHGNQDLARLLIKRGAAITIKDKKFGLTPLHLAAKNNCLDICKFLVEMSANINSLCKQNRTPLHYATMKSNRAVVEYLLSCRADITKVDKYDSFTPLHCAIKNRSCRITELLLSQGANMHQKNNNLSPIEFAINTVKDPNIVELLLDHESNRKSGFDPTNSLTNIVRSIDTLTETNKALLKHFAKVNCIFCGEHARTWSVISSSIAREFYNSCLSEINEMKNDYFFDNVTFFTLLTKNETGLRRLISDDLIRDFQKSDYVPKYPLYEKFLSKCIEKGIKLNTIYRKSSEILILILKYEFPDIVQKRILQFCSYTDLKNLEELYNQLFPSSKSETEKKK